MRVSAHQHAHHEVPHFLKQLPTEVGTAIIAMLAGVLLGNAYAGNYAAMWNILVAILLFSILSLTYLLVKAMRADRRKAGRPWLIAASAAAVVTDAVYLCWNVEEILVFGLNLTAILLLVSALRGRP